MDFPEYFKGFDSMTNKEAGMYFEWYISQQDCRIEMLRSYISNETGETGMLDFSPKSLEYLWKWFAPRIETRKRSIEEIEEDRKSIPEEFWDAIKEECFTAMTLALIIDIGFYFAAVITRNNPSIEWGYFTKPKSRAFLKEPVLVGFIHDMEMSPAGIVEVISIKTHEKRADKSLYESYLHWINNYVTDVK